jgi:HAE1 family hydrophobic/amphiphilic exporter-1
MYVVFAMALLLVFLVLAGQYESWFKPLAVIMAVPIALVGPVAVIKGLNIDNNLYTQIGLVLLIALSAKNAILVVEFARELRASGKEIVDAAVEAARARFRPIVMTSFAFILGVVPLVLAEGAGANARKSIGITVFTGMLASTCIAVLFLPAMYVVVQRFEDWWARSGGRASKAAPAEKGA